DMLPPSCVHRRAKLFIISFMVTSWGKNSPAKIRYSPLSVTVATMAARSLSRPVDISVTTCFAKVMAERSSLAGCTIEWAQPQTLITHHRTTTHRNVRPPQTPWPSALLQQRTLVAVFLVLKRVLDGPGVPSQAGIQGTINVT